MLKYFDLRGYKFLDILKKEFKNPKKKIIDGDIFLDIDESRYEDIMKSNYKDYLEIVKDLHKFLGIDFYFQTFPNFRYNSKGDKYPVWHNDRYFNHSKDEINVMIPITKNDFGFQIVGKMSYLFNKFPFSFLNSQIGKFILDKLSTKINYLDKILVFDSFHLHTASNRKNFNKPRLSIDLRLLPINHKKEYKSSKRGIPLKPGFYFSEKPISKFIN